ncbi:MAG: transglutaminase-like domain-containing protein [Planctomycetaceae bacterium]|nr:transglutaminase-like domain-containing protein [Planctomycetaceae bacterium]
MVYFNFPRLQTFVGAWFIDYPDLVVSDDILRDGGEYWEMVMDGENQIGFQRTIFRNEYYEQQSRLMLLRRGMRFDVAMTTVSVSDAEGFFESGKLRVKAGWQESVETNFQASGDKLVISAGKSESVIERVKVAGADAVIRSLISKPMLSGEKREIRYFDPSQMRVIETCLEAGGVRTSSYNSAEVKLLAISARSFIDGKMILQSRYKTDRGGNIIYSETLFGDRIIRTFRTSKKRASAIVSSKELSEFSYDGEIFLDEPIISSSELRSISFRVRLRDGGLEEKQISDLFVDSPFQRVLVIDSQNVVITVWSSVGSDSAWYGNEEYVVGGVKNNAEVLGEYLMSGSLINLDDSRLEVLLSKARLEGLSVWRKVLELERLVYGSIRSSSSSVGFASSSEVLRAGRGDCTEFAVLLAALCRKIGIPSRVVVGLVYVEDLGDDESKSSDGNGIRAGGKMVFHLWNEAYVDGIWRPIDSMYGHGGADAARIKIADDSLKNDSISVICRTILTTIGQLEIKIQK